MNKLTTEKCRTLIERLSEDKRACRISIFGELYLQALEIALPVLEQQGGWTSCSERMPEDEDYYLTHSNAGVDVTYFGGKRFSDEYATHWQPLPAPPQPSTTPQVDNDAWIEWKGGKCPLPENTAIDFICRDGDEGFDYEAREIGWHHNGAGDDIIAYRVIKNDGREG